MNRNLRGGGGGGGGDNGLEVGEETASFANNSEQAFAPSEHCRSLNFDKLCPKHFLRIYKSN